MLIILFEFAGNNNHTSATRTPTSELGGNSSVGDAIVLNLAPLEHSAQPQSLMSTFKGSSSSSCDILGMFQHFILFESGITKTQI